VKACTYLFNHKALAKVFRAKILSAIARRSKMAQTNLDRKPSLRLSALDNTQAKLRRHAQFSTLIKGLISRGIFHSRTSKGLALKGGEWGELGCGALVPRARKGPGPRAQGLGEQSVSGVGRSCDTPRRLVSGSGFRFCFLQERACSRSCFGRVAPVRLRGKLLHHWTARRSRIQGSTPLTRKLDPAGPPRKTRQRSHGRAQ